MCSWFWSPWPQPGRCSVEVGGGGVVGLVGIGVVGTGTVGEGTTTGGAGLGGCDEPGVGVDVGVGVGVGVGRGCGPPVGPGVGAGAGVGAGTGVGFGFGFGFGFGVGVGLGVGVGVGFGVGAAGVDGRAAGEVGVLDGTASGRAVTVAVRRARPGRATARAGRLSPLRTSAASPARGAFSSGR